MTELSIILPTYNEKENVPILIDKILKTLEDLKGRFEIIVVDDNSPDRTYKVAQEIGRRIPFVHALRRFHDKGLSLAVIAGFQAAKGNYFLVMDADMQHDESILPKFFQEFQNGHDIVIGSRKIDGGKIENWPWKRHLASWAAAFLAKLILRSKVSDPMSGYFGITRKVFEDTAPKINPRGFKILLEFLVHAHQYSIQEIGYTFRDRQYGKSKLSANVIMDYLIAVYELSLGRLIPFKFIQYSLVGLSGVAVNQLGLWAGKEVLSMADKKALGLGIELSILSNFFLNNYWTFSNSMLKGFNDIFIGMIKFQLVCLTGAGLNFAMTLFIQDRFIQNIYIANFVGIGVSTIWNYIINVNVTWKTKTRF